METFKAFGGTAFVCLLLVGAGPDLTKQLRKQNLDLPFDAGAQSEESEEAPDSILMYGRVYEGSAFVFCLDESLTMDYEKRFEIQNREAIRAISELIPHTEFGIKFFGGGVHSFRAALVEASPENKVSAKHFISSREVEYGTCLGKAVVEAIHMLQRASSNKPTIVVISDGQVTTCPAPAPYGCEKQKGINDQILAQISAANAGANAARRVKIHSIFVGQTDICGDSHRFMRQLANTSGGTFRVVAQ